MIYSKTVVAVIDNSGAKYVKSLTVVGGTKRQYGKLHDALLVVPKKIKRRGRGKKSLVQKRKKYIAIIIATAVNTRRRDGAFIKFLASSVVLFGLNTKLVGSALKAPLCREISHTTSMVDLKRLTTLSRQYI